MRPRLEFRVTAIVETESGEPLRENTIHRSMFDQGLIADLERFWDITRELAKINSAIAKLSITSHDGGRSVALRDPPFDPPPDSRDQKRATTIFEALRKITHP